MCPSGSSESASGALNSIVGHGSSDLRRIAQPRLGPLSGVHFTSRPTAVHAFPTTVASSLSIDDRAAGQLIA
jgi:hypothetical protein